MTANLNVTDRTKLHRRANRGSHDRAVIDAILDEALVCHIGFAAPSPVVLPTTHVRLGDQLYVHGAVANHMLASVAKGLEACVTVTLLDGLVLAKSAFHHSVNYRSVVVFGRGLAVTDVAEKRRALDALIDKLHTGRSQACRAPTDAELGATLVIAFSISEASAKIRVGPPIDDEEDMALPYQAGVIPLVTTRGELVPA
jgi:uncharacterized protein